ncbi:hypothetical protein B0H63DRAFT_107591 [Podospora didyma]|uniref:Uncharacterized protein n=1 Tax=Podospora didyma TaxID=330526 RepID=A0AAE0NYS6_9PEZI|nr:hypothetical protein B0H63DRAFT_107591 [Podospora didyma]
MTSNMPSQRPFFLSTFFAAFRQQTAPSSLSAAQQPNKHSTQAGPGPSNPYGSPSAPRTISSGAGGSGPSTQRATSPAPSRSGGVIGQLPLHSPRGGHHHHHHHSAIPIPSNSAHGHGRRRGSDSSSEGFRDARGADKLYIGGRTATGEEKFFRLGVIRRVRSGDRLSLDRLSL